MPDEGPEEQQLPKLTVAEEEHRENMFPLYQEEDRIMRQVINITSQVLSLKRDLEDAEGTLRNELKRLSNHQNQMAQLDAAFRDREAKKGNKKR